MKKNLMMQKLNQPIALVYCSDNENKANRLNDDLAAAFNFKHFKCCRDEQESILSILNDFNGPIILLISDNYLRTTQCMQQGLNMLNTYQDSILPIVVPGFRLNNDGEKSPVLANFSRFKEIVQYINYWQDRYLELRRKKRMDPDLDNEGFSNYLNNVRDIAAEVGQYLRTLQTLEPISEEELAENNYQILFEFLEEEELGEEFNQLTEPTTSQEDSQKEEDEISDIIIDNIPGLDLLPGNHSEEDEGDDEVEEKTSATPISKETPPEPKKKEENITESVETAWEMPYASAEKELKSLAKQHPDQIGINYNLAVLHIQNKSYTKAKREVNSLLKRSEADEILFLAGELADLQGKPKQAIGYFEKLAHQNEDYPHVYYLLGLLHQTLQPDNSEQAENYFEKAIQKNKKSSIATYDLALVHLKNDEKENAKRLLKRTLKIDKNHPFAHYDLAVVYHQKKSFKKAYKHYQKAIHNNPDFNTKENDIAFNLKTNLGAKKDEIKTLKEKIEALEALLASRPK